jgi:hypothetical protein
VRTVREYVQWALGAARLWGLRDGEARMLAAIASHANEHGECTASTARLAVLADRHPDTARKLIRRLKRIGLITSVNRHGRTALRTLCTDRLPVEQMELDLERLEAEQPQTTQGRPRPGTRVRVGHPRPGDPGSPATHQKELEGLKSGEERARDHAPAPEQAPSLPLLAPRFDEVLAILTAARPEILIDDRAILSALEAHPEDSGYDHVKAAHRVVAWVHDPCGGPASASAPRLLWSVLDKQATEARTARSEPAAAPRARRERPRKPWDGALQRALHGQGDPEPEVSAS